MAEIRQNGDTARFALYPSATPQRHILAITSRVGRDDAFTSHHELTVVDLLALSLAMGDYGRKIGG